MRSWAIFFVLVMTSVSAGAQQGEQEGPPPLAPAEVQRLLDGYALVQAQEFLGLSDTQFSAFLPKLRALQEVRRRNEIERLRRLQELRRLTNGRAAPLPESDLRERIRGLRDLETRAIAEIQRAVDGIDQTLDVRQQARFRVFEQEIEQRKLQLLLRARQQNRANRPLANPR